MKNLEKAETIKKLYIERLEEETKDYETYRKGVKNNEKLIHRLEKKLYSNTGGDIKSIRLVGGVSHFKETNQDALVLPKQKDGTVRSPRPPQHLSDNNMKATDRAKIIYLEKQKDDLLIRNKALHLYASGASNAFIGSYVGNDPRDRRLAALQQQLLANAKTFAQQISNLKLELMELEIRQDNKGNFEDNAGV